MALLKIFALSVVLSRKKKRCCKNNINRNTALRSEKKTSMSIHLHCNLSEKATICSDDSTWTTLKFFDGNMCTAQLVRGDFNTRSTDERF